MKPENKSARLLSITRSKAKMYEYDVPLGDHIAISTDPAKLFPLSIGLLGDLAAAINRDDDDSIFEIQQMLRFSANFFDSYFQSKLNREYDPYFILLGAASYYLCNLPGSAAVLADRDRGEVWTDFDLNCEGLEYLLLWLLQSDSRKTSWQDLSGRFATLLNPIPPHVTHYYLEGAGDKELISLSRKLRKEMYRSGTPRQLLFGDIIGAVLRKKITNSSWNALPDYSKLSRNEWKSVIQKKDFIAELWPAQHLLGQQDVLQGESAVIQMPTSAGKTKATELIVRSAFLSERASLVIIVAPFRALCHEIKNSFASAFRGEEIKVDEISDVPQIDYLLENIAVKVRRVIVITPEKLLYVLRHSPELANKIDLAIFDEGHQFDNGTRGITYELLLTSLRSLLPTNAQKIIISAVISNAEVVGQWFNGGPKVVAGANLSPTYRSLGFASWKSTLGKIEYVSDEDIDQGSFFVPRVIEQIQLKLKGRERVVRVFPDKEGARYKNSIALYLGLKLVSKGSVAIFCGKKDSASSICKMVEDIFSRDLPLPSPREHSNASELKKLCVLIAENLGNDSPATRSAEQGIFSHHGNIPHGIRLAVEHAMRKEHIKFVVCTSTLAQGVNLPIRYLIVNSIYQGNEQIKVRDFQNLMGRTGRAGMHTEGSILFADTTIFDKKHARHEKWRWKNVKELLELKNSEPCSSSLLTIFDPIMSDDGQYVLKASALDFIRAYIKNSTSIKEISENLAKQVEGFSSDNLESQFVKKFNLVHAVESFLLYHWDEGEKSLTIDEVVQLAEKTLAFTLADEPKCIQICELFKLLAENIHETVVEPAQRRIYGKTLFGIKDSKAIEQWVITNFDSLNEAENKEELLNIVWPILPDFIQNNTFMKTDSQDALSGIATKWIQGTSFHRILEYIHENKIQMRWGKQHRKFDIDHIVDLCESGFAYEGILVIACINEFIDLHFPIEGADVKTRLEQFQKQLKYGLPSMAAIVLFEAGLSDRVVALDLSSNLHISSDVKEHIIQKLHDNIDVARSIIDTALSKLRQRGLAVFSGLILIYL